MDRREPAREALQKALSFDTQPVPRAHIYLANLYARERQYLQAADELRLYSEAEPTASEASGFEEHRSSVACSFNGTLRIKPKGTEHPSRKRVKLPSSGVCP